MNGSNSILPLSCQVAAVLTVAAVSLFCPGIGSAWESELYDATWSPTPQLQFDSDKLIQDFSYAGYHRGEVPIPNPAGTTFNVVEGFGADPTGAADSTAAIQLAIDMASAAGGGVVYLPAGTYSVAPQGSASSALSIASSNVVLRGAGSATTFIVNTSYQMRGKSVIRMAGPSPNWFWNNGPSYPITADLLSPTRHIPVADTSPFSVGDWILLRNTTGDPWITEHGEPDWLGYSLSGIAYYRKVLAIDSEAGMLEIDAPTRYALKTRDSARIYIRNGALAETAVEQLSIGNVQHPGSGWGSSDYGDETKAAYDAHASWLISLRNVRDSWIRDVKTFQPAGNTSSAHLLSNGILLAECRGITVRDCYIRRPQYGGGGGNGYMYRLQHANECLVENSIAEFSRHGFVFSHMSSSGNVLRSCTDRNTGKATGSSGSYNTSGTGSDHHMQFSHSNLVDVCTVESSFFSAHYRPYGTAPKHNLTSAHSVYWNTLGTSSPVGYSVHSQQSRYGYVIGTRGAVTEVKTDGNSTQKTLPVDHVEGKGLGATLDPYSLSLDQRNRRLFLPKIDAGPDQGVFFPDTSFTFAPSLQFGEDTEVPPGGMTRWIQVDGPDTAGFDDPFLVAPTVSFPQPGVYRFELVAESPFESGDGEFTARDTVTLTVHPPGVSLVKLSPTDDTYVRGGTDNENDNFGSGDSLWMKEVGNVSFSRVAYLRFDLSGLSDDEIDDASLDLHLLGDDFQAEGDLMLVADDNWSESTLTWASRPAGAAWLQNWMPAPDKNQIFDLTPEVISEVSGDGILSLSLSIRSQTNSSTVFKFASKENGAPALRPLLLVVRSSPPTTTSLGAGDANAGVLSSPEPDRVFWEGGIADGAVWVTFEASTDGGVTWTHLGYGTRQSGGWELSGLNLEDGVQIRGRAHVEPAAGGTPEVYELGFEVGEEKPPPARPTSAEQKPPPAQPPPAQPPPGVAPVDSWSYYFYLADFYYGIYAASGDYLFATAFYHYYYGLGFYHYFSAHGMPADAELSYYLALANYWYNVYTYAGDYEGAAYTWYYYHALAYYYYYAALGNFDLADHYFGFFFSYANAVY